MTTSTNTTAPTPTASNTLFNLGDRAAALYEELTAERIDPTTGAPIVLTEDEQSAIIDAYLEAEGAVEDKVDAYCAVWRELTLRAESRGLEGKRLAALADRDSKRADSLKQRLQFYFEFHGLKKMETAHNSLSLVGNGGVLPVLVAEGTNPEDIDERFHRVIPARIEIAKDEVRNALEAGETLDFATLGVRGKRLSIK